MADRDPDSISKKVASSPDSPGVYLWKDSAGTVLYVGKAKRLRQRLRSYLVSDHSQSPKHLMLLRLIADLETIVVTSELEAFLLENNLIKEHRPQFNIQLRDDKSYPHVVVTIGEPFPRVLVVRRMDLRGARYFGPYTDVSALRRTIRTIRRVFTVRSCHYGLPDETPERPCLDYQIGRCRAPCVGYQSREEYRQMIDNVIAFLAGKTIEVRARLRESMEQAAARLEFERAAEIRNSLKWLDQVERPQSVQFVDGGDADAIGYARDGDDAVGVMLRIRTGKIVASEHRFLRNLEEEPDNAILSVFLGQHYASIANAKTRAKKALLPFAPEGSESLSGLIPQTELLVPSRGVFRRLVDLADQNARHLLESFRIESLETDERAEDPVYALGRDLGLTTLPRNLICVDISTSSQARDTVGSLVWFEAGRPKKGEYRRFKIKGEWPKDDYAAIEEVVRRYFTRRIAQDRQLPDLVLIDGGKGQLSAAKKALDDCGLKDLAVASLAKREEEVFFPAMQDGIKLPRRAPSLRLLQRARDEAHRFAVEYTRKRRKLRTLTSGLLEIPGVGEKRRRLLLEAFGSVAGISLASKEEIAALRGFSIELAERILSNLKTSCQQSQEQTGGWQGGLGVPFSTPSLTGFLSRQHRYLEARSS
ncbi:excinuclease ABC subunit UvrC [Gemmatimonadota bacterium]